MVMLLRNRRHVWVILCMSIGVSVDASVDTSSTNLRGIAKKLNNNENHNNQRKLNSFGICEAGCEIAFQCDVSTPLL
jgi:hypothetical protein